MKPSVATSTPRASEPVKMAILAKRSGVPTPTIKHYIREGLLPGPQIRTSRNMAYYDGRNVARIKAIKALQAERFLPLRVIAELLEPAPSAKLRSDRASQRQAMTALVPALSNDASERRRKLADVIDTEGVTRRELDELGRLGVIEHRGSGETRGYSGADLAIIEVVGEARRLGLGEVFPISLGEPYLRAVERLLAVEIELFQRHALTAALPAPLPDVARHAVALGGRLVLALRAKLIPALLASASASAKTTASARPEPGLQPRMPRARRRTKRTA